MSSDIKVADSDKQEDPAAKEPKAEAVEVEETHEHPELEDTYLGGDYGEGDVTGGADPAG